MEENCFSVRHHDISTSDDEDGDHFYGANSKDRIVDEHEVVRWKYWEKKTNK